MEIVSDCDSKVIYYFEIGEKIHKLDLSKARINLYTCNNKWNFEGRYFNSL